MNRMSWFGLTLLLAAGAVFSTSGMRRLSQPLPPFAGRPSENAEAGGKPARGGAATSHGGSEEANLAAQPVLMVNAVTLEEVWENSLFHPDRTEKIAVGETPAAEAPPPSEFELVGIARIGDPEKAQAVAIIKHEQPVSRSARMAAARARTMRARTQAAGGQATTPPATENTEQIKKNQKKIFRVGEEVNATGYVVKAIDPANNTVTLNKGTEEITLTIDLKDKKTSTRRQEVVTQELAEREKHKANEAAAAAATQAAAQAPPQQIRPGRQRPGGTTSDQARGGTSGAATAPATAGAAGTPPGPPSRFPSRGVRTNPNAPSASASGDGSQRESDTNNPLVNRMRYSNRPRPVQTTPQPQQ